MTYDPDTTYRLTVDIGRDLKEKMDRLLPWGLKGRVVSIVLETILNVVEQHGEIAIGALVSGRVSVLEVLSALEKGGKSDSPRPTT